jgi:hypothetical protein
MRARFAFPMQRSGRGIAAAPESCAVPEEAAAVEASRSKVRHEQPCADGTRTQSAARGTGAHRPQRAPGRKERSAST